MQTVSIYMKSGNKIKVYGVKKFTVTNTGNDITKLTVEFSPWWFSYFVGRLMVNSIDLRQIEAITFRNFPL